MFLFRLAKLLGKSVFELENTMSMSELREWAEFLSKEPVNSVEVQLALLTTIVANMMGGKKKIDDFLITSYKEDKPMYASEESVSAIFASISKKATHE